MHIHTQCLVYHFRMTRDCLISESREGAIVLASSIEKVHAALVATGQPHPRQQMSLSMVNFPIWCYWPGLQFLQSTGTCASLNWLELISFFSSWVLKSSDPAGSLLLRTSLVWISVTLPYPKTFDLTMPVTERGLLHYFLVLWSVFYFIPGL